ncbi:MAG: tRNA (adenosine(37)-N6)-dimethylallyltransferase MiaA [Rhodobacteraceae bacterium]|nr:tRNA (adenosine(37)-N6)-dimethylallyltransferase MiaA [Paracoccaceae bacterium]
MKTKAILVAGPTASGKSALALALAARTGGVIINADAIQVYRNWKTLSARPTDDELKRAPHMLYGHVDRNQSYSVGDWIKDVSDALDFTTSLPIIVGGTGLYFSALTGGLSYIPPVPSLIRTEGDMRRKSDGVQWFVNYLGKNDPDTLATLDQQNPARLQRAWEVHASSGHGLLYWHKKPVKPLLSINNTEHIVLHWDTQALNKRIERRFDTMMKTGALEECKSANNLGFNPELPSSRAIGAREIIEAINGKITMEDAVIKSKTLTRQFAKRQRTWFRSKMQHWQKIEASSTLDIEKLADKITASLP